MYYKSRNINHDCANCGKKEGGFMSSSRWEHSFNCCSDYCGMEFKSKWELLSETEQGRKELKELWCKLSSQATYVLSGEPYLGYSAEMLLKSLGRMK